MLKIPQSHFPKLDPKKANKHFKEVDAFLRDQNIDYCITGGTLLGCIRQKGFIPWDDDIDLVVSLEDTKKIEELVEVQRKTITNPDSCIDYFLWANFENIMFEIWPYTVSGSNMETAIGLLPLDVFQPHQKLPFEDWHVPAPANPIWLLDLFYSENWRTKIVRSYDDGIPFDGSQSFMIENFSPPTKNRTLAD